MNTTLYQLTDDYLALAAQIADMDVSTEAMTEALDDLRYPLEEKASKVAMIARNMEATAAAIKAAEADMAARRRALEARAAHLRDYLLVNMTRAGISKIDSPYFALSVRDNPPAVVIDFESYIPEEYMRQPETPPPVPDKKAIAAAIKAGREVPGAHLASSQRVDIK